MASQRVAVIGAGVSGLCAIKSCLEEGLDPVCYEIRNNVGGLWNYSEEVIHGQGSVMRSTVINISKEMMSFSDFPMPASAPNYLRHAEYNKYLAKYADANYLKKYINFEMEVLSVKKSDDHERSGKWTLHVKGKNEDESRAIRESFDFVLVCTGMHGSPHSPKFPGIEKFGGKIVHAHGVRNTNGFEEKRVVVVGLGNTGGDVSVELGNVASQVYLSARSGAWIFSRCASPKGYPVDYDLVSRRVAASFTYLPTSWALRNIENLSERVFRNSQFGITPIARVTQMEPTFNDCLHTSIMSGKIIIHGDIRNFTKNGVEFEDGTNVEDIDVVVMATGYDLRYPFLDKDILDVQNNKTELFNFCIPPDHQHHTMAIIGCIQPNGPVPMTVELQTRYATRVFKKLITLPSCEDMHESLRQRKEASKVRFRDTMKNAVRLDILPYCDIIAEAIGCKPDLGKMLFTDPSLAWQCFFGPVLPFQYRLRGPGKWDGARDAIMTMWDRILPANKNGTTVLKSSNTSISLPLLIPFFAMLLLPILLCVALCGWM